VKRFRLLFNIFKYSGIQLWLLCVAILGLGGGIGLLLLLHPEWVSIQRDSNVWWVSLITVAFVTLFLFSGLLILMFTSRSVGGHGYLKAKVLAAGKAKSTSTEKNADTRQPEFHRLKSHLHRRYGFFWRYKVRLLMVVGEAAQIAAVAPGLADRQWLEGSRTVLLHGGSLNDEVNKERLTALRKLRRSRPLDGIVWAVSDDQSSSSHTLDNGLRTLEQTGDALRYQPPVYLWQVCHSRWPQDERITQPVGVILPARATAEDIGRQLRSLLPKLREQGLEAFLDIFNHRILTQFYRIWRKYSYPATFEAGGKDSTSQSLLGLIGMGIPGTESHVATPVSRFLALLGIMRQPGRTAEGVQALVRLLAPKTRATVTPHCLRPVRISQPMGFYGDADFLLDGHTVLGDEITEANSQLRIALYATNIQEAQGWLPEGQIYKDFLVLLRVYLGWRYKARIELTVPTHLLPGPELGDERFLLGLTGVLGADDASAHNAIPAEFTVELGHYCGMRPAVNIKGNRRVAYHFD